MHCMDHLANVSACKVGAERGMNLSLVQCGFLAAAAVHSPNKHRGQVPRRAGKAQGLTKLSALRG